MYHLSVFADALLPGELPDDAVARLFGTHRRVKFFRTAPVEKLFASGFELGASPPEPYHYDVVLGDVLSEEVIRTFDACFEEEARRNPAWRS